MVSYEQDRLRGSFFASVKAADVLYQKGMRFIGVVKTSNSHFPLQYLSKEEIPSRGQHVSMVSKTNEDCQLMAVMWVDR